ncbi:MAG: helix-turn-helix transcriptional regulator [Acutalibacteraceae bacterium]|nr:helix-turn-helix transcriptional regulator [Acutalibacteraceae bacterium]
MEKKVAKMGIKNVVGVRVESLRKKKGLKQKDLSVALSEKGVTISSSALSKLEKQTRMVSDIELIALAEVLNVSICDLFDNDNKNIF